MNVLLTDWLRCPRCGPEFGLILLAERVQDRRVYEGWLGCANCRERYRVSGGVADLRGPGGAAEGTRAGGESASASAADPAGGKDDESAVRLAALLGLGEGHGRVALVGELSAHARRLAEVPHEFEVVQLVQDRDLAAPGAGVSPVLYEGALPLASGALAGLATNGPIALHEVEEAVRVLAHGGRVVVLEPDADAAAGLRAAGLEIMAEDPRAVVGRRSPWPGRRGKGVPLPTV